jgi:hypothetical protein
MNIARTHGEAPAAALAPEPGEAVARLSPIRVRTEPHEVAEFSRAAGGIEPAGLVPLTFPVRWLALPAIRGLILQALGGEGSLPVHEAQSFAYDRELQVDTEYILAVEARRSAKPPRLTLHAAVLTTQQEMCMRFETVLRVVPLTPSDSA